MANPFETKRDSQCMSCEETVEQGEEMYYHEDMYLCRTCADEADCVCDCGNYKKPEYDCCYTCRFG